MLEPFFFGGVFSFFATFFFAIWVDKFVRKVNDFNYHIFYLSGQTFLYFQSFNRKISSRNKARIPDQTVIKHPKAATLKTSVMIIIRSFF